MPWPTKNRGKKRKRELRVKKQAHRRGSKKAGSGWAARQASKKG